MKKRTLDFLSRRAVLAKQLLEFEENESQVARRLPEGYIYENGAYRFPAGTWESYFVNGKEYNTEGDRTLQEQQELIIRDLESEGFTEGDARQFIDELETVEWRPIYLDWAASDKWLKQHPEYKEAAMMTLREARAETMRNHEQKSEVAKRIKRR